MQYLIVVFFQTIRSFCFPCSGLLLKAKCGYVNQPHTQIGVLFAAFVRVWTRDHVFL
jgi:hypothetical protein